MKKRNYPFAISLVVGVLLATSAMMAQEIKPSALEYSDVVQVEGVKAGDLYLRAKVWFAHAFVDSKNVLEVEDKESGILVGKGTVEYEPKMLSGSACVRGHISFTISVEVKDGKYKYTLTDFMHTGSPNEGMGQIDFGFITDSIEPPNLPKAKLTSKGWRKKVWDDIKEVAKIKAEGLIDSLKKEMAAVNKDW